ncbi:MAG: tungstate transport system ATP-binding protein [Thermoanaerobacteraceae bacterium]|nr:tungstate transport system ATP-binding protein [Thermoanaerobacteraceae bacterium]MDN5312968.1 tungstate transport system ATP-binding protein [Thermoanaerobacteraceae bacterium]
MYIIEGQDISVRAGKSRILEVKRVGLEEGKVFSVIGPNGSGKSTLLRVMALLQNPDDGRVHFRGERVLPRDRIRIRRRMAVVFQEPLLLDATVEENIVTGLRIRGVDAASARRRAGFWLERFKVAHLSDRWTRALSGGEAQRVSLARAFALEPEVLFLDEPFANLDAPTREALLLELSDVLHSTGVTTFFVSHDFKEVAFLADRTMALMEGLPVQEAPPQRILDYPACEKLARFVGIENIWPAKILEERLETLIADIKGLTMVVKKAGDYEYERCSSVGDEVKIALRGDKINFIPLDACSNNLEIGCCQDGSIKQNCWNGRVKSLFAFGNVIRMTVDCGIDVNISVPAQFMNAFKIGDNISLYFSIDSPIILKK